MSTNAMRRWVCQVVNGDSPCRASSPNPEHSHCGYRWQLLLTDAEYTVLMNNIDVAEYAKKIARDLGNMLDSIDQDNELENRGEE